MPQPSSPCMGCNRRSVTCHGECKEYSLYKDEMEEYNHLKYIEIEKMSWTPSRINTVYESYRKRRGGK